MPESFLIFLVDDQTDVLRALSRTLGELFSAPERSCEVRCFSDPMDAWIALRNAHARHPNLMVSDTNMPKMQGPALLAETRRHAPLALRVLMSSAYGDAARAAVTDGSAMLFFPKPWEEKDLERIKTFVAAATAGVENP